MKDWFISKPYEQAPHPQLRHMHSNEWGYICRLATDDHWYCGLCDLQAPEEIEDAALLARCAPYNDVRPHPPNRSRRISPP